MLIGRSNMRIISTVICKFLSTRFSMKDLGVADTISGIKIIRTESNIALSQSHYIEIKLNKNGYFELLELSIPYDYNKKFRLNTGETVKQYEYSRIIGME